MRLSIRGYWSMSHKIGRMVTLEDVSCPLGCIKSDLFLFSGRDRIHDREGEFSVVQCLTCGLIRTNQRPTVDTIGYYYPDSYGPYRGTEIHSDATDGNKQSCFVRLLKKVIQLNVNCIPDLPVGRMLEIGCASGAYLHKMKQLGWEVAGIEPSVYASQQASRHGYSIFNGPVESAPDPLIPYDLIVGWMVLEHLHEPVNALKKMHKWSSPSAQLVLSVPNADSLEFKLFKSRWYALHLPAHLFHFTPKTVERLLEKCGWRVQRILHQRSLSNLIASIGYWLQDREMFSRVASLMIRFPEARPAIQMLLYPLSLIFSIFGQTGRMTIWARKMN